MRGWHRPARAAGAGFAWLLALALAIGGCGGWFPTSDVGPTIVIDVSNASGSELAVGYALVDDGAEATEDTVAVLPCQRGGFGLGAVADGYRVIVDGLTRYQGRVPPSAGVEDSLVITVDVEPSGQVTIIGMPEVAPADEVLTPVEEIPGCEPTPSATN